MADFKNIHIGRLIKDRVKELDITTGRICNFLNCDEKNITEMYESESLDCMILLKWSKLLEYDFFRIYTQHLVLFAPGSRISNNIHRAKILTKLPKFRKNIYTKEIIDFVIELVESGKKTKQQITDEYNIPKSTLYKWFNKY